MSAIGLLQGVLLSAHLISIANVHSSAHAEALARAVPPDRLAPILDVDKLPATTADGRVISRSPAHHLQNCLRKRIARGEIPPPDTVGVSMAMLMRVAGALAELNRAHQGSWASLAYLSEKCDASPSQIRAVHVYLVEHGHALRLSRLAADDRKIGGAKRPLVTTRTTIRPVFAVTCDMVEALSEEEVLDLIALGEKRPVATLPGERAAREVPRDVEAPRRDAESDAQTFLRELAPEHRCLVEPLAAIALFTGIDLPTSAVKWVAEEAEEAGLLGFDDAGYTHAADALDELLNDLKKARRGAEAMGDPLPKIHGGRSGLRDLITRYLNGKSLWLKKHGDVYQARDAARAREAAYAATLSEEQRERRGLALSIEAGCGASFTTACLDDAPVEAEAPSGARGDAAAPTPHEQAVHRLRTRIAMLGAVIFAEVDSTKKSALEAERAEHERRLDELREQGPPE